MDAMLSNMTDDVLDTCIMDIQDKAWSNAKSSKQRDAVLYVIGWLRAEREERRKLLQR